MLRSPGDRRKRGESASPFGLEPTLAARNLSGNAGVTLTGEIHGFGKCFEEAFHDVMWFPTMEQFEVKIALRFVGKALKELAG